MKRLTIILILLVTILFKIESQVSWHLIPSPVNENLTSVFIIGSNKIIAVSDQGTIASTTDEGKAWQLSNFEGCSFKCIYFTDNENGFAVSSGSNVKLFKTNNGGKTWQIFFVDSLDTGNGVFFTDENKGFVVGSFEDKTYLRHTDNGGETWESVFMPLIMGSELLDIFFRDPDNGNAIGTNGCFYSSNNGGQVWNMDVSFSNVNLNSIFNFDEQNGVMVGDGAKTFFTINKWYQHIDLNTNVIEDLNGVWGAQGTNKIWAVGNNGTIIYMNNYLLGWTSQNSGTTENLNDVYILNENYGVAVGDNGAILLLSNNDGVNEHNLNTNLSVLPVPASDYIKVRFTLYKTTKISLNIVDITGKIIIRLMGGEKQMGNHDYTFDISLLKNGIYFVRFKTIDYWETKKVIVAK